MTHKPMLLTETDDPAKYVMDEHWAVSQKIDGQRCVTFVKEGVVTAISRSGIERDLPTGVEETLAALEGTWSFDGELLGREYWIFDLLETPSLDLREIPWITRVKCLQQMFDDHPFPHLELVPWHTDRTTKAKFFDDCSMSEVEGVVFKKIDSTYKVGRSKDWFKYKFLRTIDCVVVEKARGGKANIVLGVYKGDKLVEVGKVSGLQGDGEKVKVGDVVEISCLYVTSGNRIFHPKLPRIRTDKEKEECTWDQMKACQTNKVMV